MSTNKNESFMSRGNTVGLINQHLEPSAYEKVEKVYYSLETITEVVENIKTIEDVVSNMGVIKFIVQNYSDIASAQSLLSSVQAVIIQHNDMLSKINTNAENIKNVDNRVVKDESIINSLAETVTTTLDVITASNTLMQTKIDNLETTFLNKDGSVEPDHINVTNTAKAKDVEASESVKGKNLIGTEDIKLGETTLTATDKDVSVNGIKLLKEGEAIQYSKTEEGVNSVNEVYDFSQGITIKGKTPVTDDSSDIVTSYLSTKLVKSLPLPQTYTGSSVRTYLMLDGGIKAVGDGYSYGNGDRLGHRYVPTKVCAESNDVKFVSITTGWCCHFALTAEGEVWSWGNNAAGQLGHGDTTNLFLAKRIEYFVTNSITIKKIVTSRTGINTLQCVYFITTLGEVYCCGSNTDGNLGIGNITNQSTPVRCGALTGITDLCISSRPHSCYALQDTGDLWTWGWNQYGQLGVGDTVNRTIPILNTTVKNVSQILVACDYLTNGTDPAGTGFVLLEDGTVWWTGWSGYGNIGSTDTTSSSGFKQMIFPKDNGEDTKISKIAYSNGRYPSFAAVTTKKYVYVTGFNESGQLGVGNTNNQSGFQNPDGVFQGHVDDIKFGGNGVWTALFIQSGNLLFSSGYSVKGNLGTGSVATNNVSFNLVVGVTKKIKDWRVSGGGNNEWGLLVLYEDGTVDACGSNLYGETGTMGSAIRDSVATLASVQF